jgi:hypothetical protein
MSTTQNGDSPGIPQALIKRNPSMTKEQFSTHWFENHASIVIPYFLSVGVEYYAQIHNPVLLPDASTSPENQDLDISDWDGAAELKFADVKPERPHAEVEASTKYWKEVIVEDEKRFLVSPALDHVRRIAANTVDGERRVIIEDGKVVPGLNFDANLEVWNGFVSGGRE